MGLLTFTLLHFNDYKLTCPSSRGWTHYARIPRQDPLDEGVWRARLVDPTFGSTERWTNWMRSFKHPWLPSSSLRIITSRPVVSVISSRGYGVLDPGT